MIGIEENGVSIILVMACGAGVLFGLVMTWEWVRESRRPKPGLRAINLVHVGDPPELIYQSRFVWRASELWMSADLEPDWDWPTKLK